MRLLIIRMSSIGDVILTTPVLKALKQKYPASTIDFLVLETFKDAILGSPYVDNIIVFDKKKNRGVLGLVRFARTLQGNKYDYIFDLHAKIRSYILCPLLRGKTYRYKKRSWWKSILVNMKLMKYSADDTIVKNYFKPFHHLGVSYQSEDLSFSFSEGDLQKVRLYKGAVVIAFGASKHTKAWRKQGFGELASMIHHKQKKKVVLVGGKEDIEVGAEINKISGAVCIDLAGKLSLKESAALLSLSSYSICNDSAVFHLSRAVGTYCFTIFGPTDPQMFEWDSSKTTLVRHPVSCAPCTLHGDRYCPKGHWNCMNKLKAERIFSVIEEQRPSKKV